jgi:hypothetical protein
MVSYFTTELLYFVSFYNNMFATLVTFYNRIFTIFIIGLIHTTIFSTLTLYFVVKYSIQSSIWFWNNALTPGNKIIELIFILTSIASSMSVILFIQEFVRLADEINIKNNKKLYKEKEKLRCKKTH